MKKTVKFIAVMLISSLMLFTLPGYGIISEDYTPAIQINDNIPEQEGAIDAGYLSSFEDEDEYADLALMQLGDQECCDRVELELEPLNDPNATDCCWKIKFIRLDDYGCDPEMIIMHYTVGGTTYYRYFGLSGDYLVGSGSDPDYICLNIGSGAVTFYFSLIYEGYECAKSFTLSCDCCFFYYAGLTTSTRMEHHEGSGGFDWDECFCVYDFELVEAPGCGLDVVSYQLIDDVSGTTMFSQTAPITFPITESWEKGIPCVVYPGSPIYGSVFHGHVEIELSDGTICYKDLDAGCCDDCCDLIHMNAVKISAPACAYCCYDVTISTDEDFWPECPTIHGISRIVNGVETVKTPYDASTPMTFPITYTDCNIPYGATVTYIFYLADGSAMNCEKSYEYECTVPRIKSMEEGQENREQASISILKLYNVPNPARDRTTIYYQLSEQCEITLDVYNSIGELLTTLYTGNAGTGLGSIELNTDGYANGSYIVKLNACGVSKVLPINIAK